MHEAGYCQCGCGGLAPVAKLTRRGYVKGESMRFIQGHHLRVAEYKANLYTEQRNAKISAAHTDGRIPHGNAPSGAASPLWRGEQIGYTRAHARVVAARGPATGCVCMNCGDAAQEWAVNHAHETVRSVIHMGRRKAMSGDVMAYEPLCRTCHRTADARGGYRA